MSDINRIASDLYKVMSESNDKAPKPYDTTATVTRIDGDIAWVQFPGGDTETPVQRTTNAVVGDSVQVRVNGGRAWLLGNTTNPPTDDTVANIANTNSVTALGVAEVAKVAAENAVTSAEQAKEAAEGAVESASIAEQAATAAQGDAATAANAATQAQADAATSAQAATQAQASASTAANQATSAAGSATQARASAVRAQEQANSASASATAAQANAQSAQNSANAAGENAARSQAAAEAAEQAALATIVTDTIHYLATNLASGVTRSTPGWTTTVQTMDATNRYLWTYHTYTSANSTTTDTDPIITGTYGKDGTSVTILGSYNTLAELQAAHPTGNLGDAYMVAGDLYVWNGSAWTDVGQIQGPVGPQGATGPAGSQGVGVTAVQPQYYLSTSTSSATGGSWGTSISYAAERYIWTRDRITYTNPATGTSTTKYSTAVYNQALTESCAKSFEALGLVQEQQEYFWHDSLGAHILSSKNQAEIRYRTDLKGAGQEIFQQNTDGTESSVAKFGADGARIGSIGESRIEMDYHSLQQKDIEGNPYVWFSDLRDADGNYILSGTFTRGSAAKEFRSYSNISNILPDSANDVWIEIPSTGEIINGASYPECSLASGVTTRIRTGEKYFSASIYVYDDLTVGSICTITYYLKGVTNTATINITESKTSGRMYFIEHLDIEDGSEVADYKVLSVAIDGELIPCIVFGLYSLTIYSPYIPEGTEYLIKWNAPADKAKAFTLGRRLRGEGIFYDAGASSFAFGADTIANAEYTYAIGRAAEASGSNAFAIGAGAKASETNSYAFGHEAVANRSSSIAMGDYALTEGRIFDGDGGTSSCRYAWGSNYPTGLYAIGRTSSPSNSDDPDNVRNLATRQNALLLTDYYHILRLLDEYEYEYEPGDTFNEFDAEFFGLVKELGFENSLRGFNFPRDPGRSRPNVKYINVGDTVTVNISYFDYRGLHVRETEQYPIDIYVTNENDNIANVTFDESTWTVTITGVAPGDTYILLQANIRNEYSGEKIWIHDYISVDVDEPDE